jgi:acyl dehydratase
MIDRKWIGHELPPSRLTLDRNRLQYFAKATGQTDPVYSDVEAARAAGYADIPAPPTFLIAIELDSGAADRLLADLQIPLAKLLHGEQGFTCHRVACAGDTVTVRSTVTDIYDKKGGALEFIVRKTAVSNAQGEAVAELRCVTVYRNPKP